MWGVKGWLKVRSHTDRRRDILDHPVWFLGEEREARRLIAGREQGRVIVALLDGATDRDQASRFVGKTVNVPLSALPPLAEGEYYWAQLHGLQAVDPSGAKLGVTRRLLETGANPVLVIEDDGREILVPFVAGVVRRVDLDNRLIELDWEADY